MSHDRTVISDPIVLALAKGRELIDPPMRRRTWDNSRLFINPDGSTTPVLVELANHVFGPWDPMKFYPVWKDKDYCNESPDNVQLVERGGFGHTKSNPYGVPAGTPEYYKRDRAANLERMRAIRQTAYRKRKEDRERVKTLEQENLRLRNLMTQGGAVSDGPSAAEVLNHKLQNIIGEE